MQTLNRLQKLGLCLAHTGTIQLLDLTSITKLLNGETTSLARKWYVYPLVLPRQFQFFYCRKWNPKRYQLILRCLIRAIMCLSNLLRVRCQDHQIAYPLPIPQLLLCIVYQVFPANHFSQLMVCLYNCYTNA